MSTLTLNTPSINPISTILGLTRGAPTWRAIPMSPSRVLACGRRPPCSEFSCPSVDFLVPLPRSVYLPIVHVSCSGLCPFDLMVKSYFPCNYLSSPPGSLFLFHSHLPLGSPHSRPFLFHPVLPLFLSFSYLFSLSCWYLGIMFLALID